MEAGINEKMLNEITGWVRNVLKKSVCEFELISPSTEYLPKFSALTEAGFPDQASSASGASRC